MSCRDVDPLAQSFIEEPYEIFRALRNESPVHFVASRNMWIVTRYDDVVAAARNTAVFSSTGGVGYDWNQRPMMPMYDPPEHTRMRRIVAKHFTPATVSAFKPRVESLVADIMARALATGSIDVVQDLALPLSLGTIAELLGVPPDLRVQLRRWSQGTVEDLAGGLVGADARRVDELRREFNVYLRSLIEERSAFSGRRQGALDVISALVAARDDEKLSSQELVAFCVLLLVAGYETTVNAIANGVLALLEHPAELAKLRRDRSLLPQAIEEMVRYDGPVLSFFRNTLEDSTLASVAIPKGAKVMLAFASANRDERKFPDADVFQIGRGSTDHLGYGSGVHFCLGAPLARMQLLGIFGALLDHVDVLEATGPAVRSGNVLFRGIRSLPVRITASAAAPAARQRAPSATAPAAAAPGLIESFAVAVPDEVLVDLRERLARARWPDEVAWGGWDYGTPVGYLRELVDYWRDGFDWRAAEARLNEHTHFRTTIDDISIHFLHIRAQRPGATPLLVLHGWPGPYNLFSRILEPLTSPADGSAGFDLVVASLPGFPLSGGARKRGMGTMSMANLFAQLMTALGYPRFGVIGEDWGAGVASRLGLAYPERVIGIHLNMPHENPSRDQMTSLTPEEKTWLRAMGRFRDKSLTHFPVQQRNPQSMTYGLQDSPVGLAGWLVDKYRAWSDCDGVVERRFTKDDLLTNITLYWATSTIGSSMRIYFEARQLPWFLEPGERIEVPTAIALCKHELVQPPRRWIERVYNLQRLTHVPAGGHFGAWEEPAAIADDVRAFFAGLPVDVRTP